MGTKKLMSNGKKILIGLAIFIVALIFLGVVNGENYLTTEEMESVIAEDLNHEANVFYDEYDGVYEVYLSDRDLVAEVEAVMSYGYGYQDWNILASNVASYSTKIAEETGEVGFIRIMSPVNSGRFLLEVRDGTITYDFIRDGNR